MKVFGIGIKGSVFAQQTYMIFSRQSVQLSRSNLGVNLKIQQNQKERGVIPTFSDGFMNSYLDSMSCTYLGGVSNVSF